MPVGPRISEKTIVFGWTNYFTQNQDYRIQKPKNNKADRSIKTNNNEKFPAVNLS